MFGKRCAGVINHGVARSCGLSAPRQSPAEVLERSTASSIRYQEDMFISMAYLILDASKNNYRPSPRWSRRPQLYRAATGEVEF
jgi:hypothetical protein